MANTRTILDEWSVRDLEDNSSINVMVENCTELGNKSLPGIQVFYMGNYITFEPLVVEQWVYKAGKMNASEYLLEDRSWMAHTDQYVKISLLMGSPLKAKVEVKTRTSKPVSKEYALPFEV
jgi:hypothetical protein